VPAGPVVMAWPATLVGPPPSPDMPTEILDDYNEARAIGATSTRAAAALLRLCVQRLCVVMGLPGKSIDATSASWYEGG